MKTEQINVPHFEGFECVGLDIPDGNEHYVLSPDGSRLVQMNGYCVQVCYKKISPRTMTLMYIPRGIAQDGDYTEDSDSDLMKCCPGEEYLRLWRPI